jgi:hypothetical protein
MKKILLYIALLFIIIIIISANNFKLADNSIFVFKTNDSLKIGSSVINYVSIDSINGIRLHGSAIVWDDIRGNVNSALTGTATWTLENYASTGFPMAFLRHDQDDQINMELQMPHSRLQGSILLDCHIHAIGMSNVTGDVRFKWYYTFAKIGDVVINDTALWTKGYKTITINGTDQFKHKYYDIINNITPPVNEGVSSILYVILRRLGSASTLDTYNSNKTGGTGQANFGLQWIDAHSEINSMGSNQELIK